MTRKTTIDSGDLFECSSAHPFDAERSGPVEDIESRLAALRLALVEGELSGRADYSYVALIAELDAISR